MKSSTFTPWSVELGLGRAGLLLALFVHAGCGGADDAGELVEQADSSGTDEAAVIGGVVDVEHVQVGRVGRLERDGLVAWFCSGTLVGARTVLTAAHCLFDRTDRRLRAPQLAFGIGASVFAVVRSSVLGTYAPGSAGPWDDAAVLGLEAAPNVEPIPVATSAPGEGSAARVVGFGVTRATGPQQGTGGGVRRRTTIRLDAVTERELRYLSDAGGACYGDSGGPLLARSEAGRWQVVGVTSRGRGVYCDQENIATRIDALRSWIRRVSRRDVCEGECP
jgi:secreted trypsin-like serine protease